MQGRGACVLSKFFACVNRKASRGKTEVRESNPSGARLGENSAERKQNFSDFLYVVAEATTHKEFRSTSKTSGLKTGHGGQA